MKQIDLSDRDRLLVTGAAVVLNELLDRAKAIEGVLASLALNRSTERTSRRRMAESATAEVARKTAKPAIMADVKPSSPLKGRKLSAKHRRAISRGIRRAQRERAAAEA
jgi:hypothetical protein